MTSVQPAWRSGRRCHLYSRVFASFYLSHLSLLYTYSRFWCVAMSSSSRLGDTKAALFRRGGSVGFSLFRFRGVLDFVFFAWRYFPRLRLTKMSLGDRVFEV